MQNEPNRYCLGPSKGADLPYSVALECEKRDYDSHMEAHRARKELACRFSLPLDSFEIRLRR